MNDYHNFENFYHIFYNKYIFYVYHFNCSLNLNFQFEKIQ